MQKLEPLSGGNYYHIGNCGINNCSLFYTTAHYEHVFRLYDKYISPVADTFAWVLMPDHFHFLVRIKENIAYKYSLADKLKDAAWFEEHKWETLDLSACEAPDSVKTKTTGKFDIIKTPVPHLHFSHLFNAYTKHVNEHFDRRGSLFERQFKRTVIESETHLKQIVRYIHNHPVQHGFCKHPSEYPWSSYRTFLSTKQTKLQREKVIGWFGNEQNFVLFHDDSTDTIETKHFDDWLEK